MAGNPHAAIWPGLLILAIAASGPLTSLARTHTTAQAGYELRTVKLDDGNRVVARRNPCRRDIGYPVDLTGITRGQRRPCSPRFGRPSPGCRRVGRAGAA